jgi:hypothetical protein
MKPSTLLLAALVALCTAASAQKYPLTMTAVYTAAHRGKPIQTTFRDGEYTCTAGEPGQAPLCKTDAEWSEI